MALPNHLSLQANYLRQLNQRGDAEAVIRQFEGGRVTSTEATLGEYVKALVKVDRLDSSALVHTLQVSSAYQLPNSDLLHGVCLEVMQPFYCRSGLGPVCGAHCCRVDCCSALHQIA